MITMYDKPKKVTLKELIENTTDSFKYIERFEYGDYDNFVTAIVDYINIALRYSHVRVEETEQGPVNVYSVCLESAYKSMYEVDDKGIKDTEPFFGYSSNYSVKRIEDLLEMEMEVVGEWKR